MSELPQYPSVLGLPADEAQKALVASGWRCRITRTDGRPHICTQDFRTDRVNLHVENGVVTDASVG